MSRIAIISILTIAGLIAWQSYAVWSMLQNCSVRAHEQIESADPLDRDPPPQVRAVVEQNIQIDHLLDFLATLLLDRYNCRGGANWANGTDWLIDHPLLARHLRTSFGKREVIALFAATADMGKGDIGLSRGARRIYKRDLSQLSDADLKCLVLTPFGKQVTSSSSFPEFGFSGCADTVFETPR